MSLSTGIIGGSDGPTAIFVSGKPNPSVLVGSAVAVALVVLVVRALRRKAN